MKFWSYNTFYIQLYKNRVVIKHIETSRTISRESPKEFSNNRSVIADYETLESFLKAVLNEFVNSSWFGRLQKFLIHVREEGLDDLSPVETRALLDSAEKTGAKIVAVHEGKDELSDHAVIDQLDHPKGDGKSK